MLEKNKNIYLFSCHNKHYVKRLFMRVRPVQFLKRDTWQKRENKDVNFKLVCYWVHILFVPLVLFVFAIIYWWVLEVFSKNIRILAHTGS